MIALFSTDMIPPRLHQKSLIYLFFGKIRSRTPFSIARFGKDLRVLSESGWMRSTLKAKLEMVPRTSSRLIAGKMSIFISKTQSTPSTSVGSAMTAVDNGSSPGKTFSVWRMTERH